MHSSVALNTFYLANLLHQKAAIAKYNNGVVICIWTGFNVIFSQRLSHSSWLTRILSSIRIGRLVSKVNTWTKCKAFIISSFQRTWHHDMFHISLHRFFFIRCDLIRTVFIAQFYDGIQFPLCMPVHRISAFKIDANSLSKVNFGSIVVSVFRVSSVHCSFNMWLAFAFAINCNINGNDQILQSIDGLKRWRDTVLYVNIQMKFFEVVSARNTADAKTKQHPKSPTPKIYRENNKWAHECCTNHFMA